MRFRRPSFRRAPSEESSGKRRKLENKVENQEQAILSHAESFQMTIDGYTEEKVQQEKELKEVQQATFQKLSRIQATIEFYSGLLKAFNALKEIPFEQRGMHIQQAQRALFLETVEELEG